MTNRVEHSEGPVARSIEQQTAKLPSDIFLWAAGLLYRHFINAQTSREGARIAVRRTVGADIFDPRPLQQARKTTWFGSNRQSGISPPLSFAKQESFLLAARLDCKISEGNHTIGMTRSQVPGGCPVFSQFLLLMEFDFDPGSGALSSLIPEAAAFANQAIESSFKNQGPGNPYLAFNNFRAIVAPDESVVKQFSDFCSLHFDAPRIILRSMVGAPSKAATFPLGNQLDSLRREIRHE